MSKTSFMKSALPKPSRSSLERVRDQQAQSLAQLKSDGALSPATQNKIAAIKAAQGGPTTAAALYPNLKSAAQHSAEQRAKEIPVRKSRAWS